MDHLHTCKQCGREYRCECESPAYFDKGVCLSCVTANSRARQNQQEHEQRAFDWT